MPAAKKGSPRKRTLGAGIIALLLAAVMMFVPTNFVIRSPGPVFNTLGEVDGHQLLALDGARTYETDSELDMLTVYVQGGGANRVTVPVVLEALLNPHKDVVPEETVLPHGVSSQQQQQQNDSMMVSSQDLAVAAALTELGIEYKSWLTVSGFSSPQNEQQLQTGDKLLEYNGEKISSLEQLKKRLNEQGKKPGTLLVERTEDQQKPATRKVKVSTTAGPDGTRQLGIYLGTTHDFPLKATFGLENVGGPSAGMMFALSIIDRLTPGSLAGKTHVAGTGEITEDGQVGPIGGIAQKMVAASKAGATVFLAPAGNCSEVAGRIPDGLDVIKVSTLSEARKDLEAIAKGTDPATLGTCQ